MVANNFSLKIVMFQSIFGSFNFGSGDILDIEQDLAIEIAVTTVKKSSKKKRRGWDKPILDFIFINKNDFLQAQTAQGHGNGAANAANTQHQRGLQHERNKMWRSDLANNGIMRKVFNCTLSTEEIHVYCLRCGVQ